MPNSIAEVGLCNQYRRMNSTSEIPRLFPLHEYWPLYAAFLFCVACLLILDLGVRNRKARELSFREAALWSAIWVTLALLFNYGFYQFALYKFPLDPRLQNIPGLVPDQLALSSALEFLAGYVIEKSLSVDNIFVFVVVFGYFAVPLKNQYRVLFFGIIGAVLLRALFIALGTNLIKFHAVEIIFGAFLLFTGVKLFFVDGGPPDPSANPVIKFCKRHLRVTDQFHGQKFFVREDGKWLATPLFLALIFVEFSDIVFAVDSVPAIFGITHEPFIVFTSNIFAILGLRSMYFMLASIVDKFHLLKYGLGVVLVFVGLKMIWLDDLFGGRVPIMWSLSFIVVAIGGSIGLSFVIKPKKS